MIKIVDLYKSFGENHVLNGVNLDIQRGETMVIIGRSGCGKSVLVKHMIGLIRPDQGQIIVDGDEITNNREEELPGSAIPYFPG
jgi:phospholipid/cholesterol/gamma-HCH transport system ATP-binding protein